MPSSYSPELRLELPADGEQVGLWGQLTNRNLGTLLESSISGLTQVSVTTANQALTALNGVDDQARHSVLVLSTTTTAPFAVYAPPVSKSYIVVNATAYAATIFNSTALGNTTAAGVGVAVPPGKRLLVFSDGAGFYTIDAVNLTGVLAVANGGTGVSTSTGTGSTVLSVSPTFTGVPVAPTATPGNAGAQIATTAYADAAVAAVRLALYPIGSIYINAGVTTNPATLLGFGTWVAFGAGRVMVGLNGADALFDTLEETGGSKDATVVSHTHTATSTVSDPGHVHAAATGAFSVTGNVAYSYGGFGSSLGTANNTASATTGVTVATTVASAGATGTNANLQPYITVAMWKRTA